MKFRQLLVLLCCYILLSVTLVKPSFSQDGEARFNELRESARRGDVEAQVALGIVYGEGFLGVSQNPSESEYWYTKAAEQGNEKAQSTLAYKYEKGDFGFVDYKKAMKWDLKAAEQGNMDSMCGVGDKYLYGKGVIQDYVVAHMWFNIAASHGHYFAGKIRDELQSMMTSSQVAEAQKLARQWMEAHRR